MTKIMVVDDDRDIRVVVRTILDREGYEVTEAESGEECLEMLIEGERPDLMLLNVMMPKMDGWEVSRRIKDIDVLKDIRICMLTAKTTTLDALMSLESAHANWHLNKPVNKKQLIDTVRWLIERPPQ